MSFAPGRATCARRASTALVLAAALGLSSCQAVPPTAPAPTAGGITILYSRPTRPDFSFQLQAYVVDSDGAYTNVTNQSQWSTSNPAIVELFPGNSIGGKSALARAAGVATLLATYEGRAGELFVQVPAGSNSRPLRLILPQGPLSGIGDELRLNATFSEAGRVTDVTSFAGWTSSDPSVASVGQGVVRSLHIGTTQITVTFQGVTDYALVSVHPGRGGL